MNERAGRRSARAGWAAGWPRSSRRGPDRAAPRRHRAASVHARAARRAARQPRPDAVRRRADARRPRAELPRDRRSPRSSPTRSSRAPQFDEEALAELEHSIREFGLLQPIVVRETRPGTLRARHGRAPLAGRAARRAATAARDRPAHRRRRDAPRRAAGEHPPRPAQPARRGRRLRAAARRVRRHAHRARRPARPQPPGRHEHDPAAEAAGARCSAGSRPACSPPGTPARCSALDDAGQQEELAARIVAEGMSVRATEEAVRPRCAARAADSSRRPARRRPMHAPGSAGSGRAAVRPLRHARARSSSASARDGSSSSSGRWRTWSASPSS